MAYLFLGRRSGHVGATLFSEGVYCLHARPGPVVWFYAKACISFLSVQALCKSIRYVLFETWMNYVLFGDE